MQCNIDARGKAARLIIGAVVLIIGVALVALWWQGSAEWALFAALGAGLGGAFAMFEGAAGWCALRALGVRTRI